MPNIRTVAQAETATQLRASGKSKIKCIMIERIDGATQDLYLQLFDAASPTIGTTAPNDVYLVKAPADNKKSRNKIIFAGKYGGKIYGTALSMAVTTTHDGNTAPTAGQAPNIEVCYEPLT